MSGPAAAAWQARGAIRPDAWGGRELRLPAASPVLAEDAPLVVLVYGHHAALERWLPLAQVLSAYGEVVAPDLPGFGGMPGPDRAPRWLTLAAQRVADVVRADHRAGRPVILVGVSYGFVAIDEALGTFPDVLAATSGVLGISGFNSSAVLTLRPSHLVALRSLGRATRARPVTAVCRRLASSYRVTATVDRVLGTSLRNARGDRERARRLRRLDHALWSLNRIDVHWQSLSELTSLSPGGSAGRAVPLVHVASREDRYVAFEQNLLALRSSFAQVRVVEPPWGGHTPTLDAGPEAYEFLTRGSAGVAIGDMIAGVPGSHPPERPSRA